MPIRRPKLLAATAILLALNVALIIYGIAHPTFAMFARVPLLLAATAFVVWGSGKPVLSGWTRSAATSDEIMRRGVA
jgi:hypothetical protein